MIFLCYDWKHKKKCFKHITTEIAGTIIETKAHHTGSPKANGDFRRISKSEPRCTTTSNSIHEMKPVLHKPKGPPPPPPLVPPYLPPMRSLSQPPPRGDRISDEGSEGSDTPMNPYGAHKNPSNIMSPGRDSKTFSHSVTRPSDPPPPIPELNHSGVPEFSGIPELNHSGSPPAILHPKPQLAHFNPSVGEPNRAKPRVPYNTRPDISKVPYFQKKYAPD